MARECLRVDQLDATILDEEYRQIALDQLSSTLDCLPVSVSRRVEKVKPEVELAVDAALWSTRLAEGASPGQMEEDVAYKDYTPKKIAVHFALQVLLPYISKRVPQMTDSVQWARAFNKVEAVWELISMVHYLRFLRKGGHSNVLESVLSLRNWNNNLPTIGTVNYESQNRELLWHAFRDALLLGWPIAHAARHWWTRRGRVAVTGAEHDARVCGACGRDAVVPVRWSGCGHVACYWCDASRKERECVVCGGSGKAEMVRGKRIV